MNERNVIGGVTAAALSAFADVFVPLKWMLIAAVVLIICDLRFGIEAAMQRGEKIRPSRAIRRTINKVVDYVCWIFLAASIGAAFGEAFGVTYIPAIVLLVIYGLEINSCFANYFEAHGIKGKVDIFKWFRRQRDIIEVEEAEVKIESEGERDDSVTIKKHGTNQKK